MLMFDDEFVDDFYDDDSLNVHDLLIVWM